ncbi:sulfurtransferase TusA family protein [Acetobacter ghanensis]|uniref:sulfurtransferase TusA family protein n=1 Tax=Acetobacter ghanensis TaxID=431306 RepID=UPI003D346545
MNDTLMPGREDGTCTAVLDITSETCPMTFVRTRLALDVLPPGGLLAVRLKGEEPHRNVSRSVRALGHAILADAPQPDGSVVLTIRKKEAASA